MSKRIVLLGLLFIHSTTNLIGMHDGAELASVNGVSLSVKSHGILQHVKVSPRPVGAGTSSTRSNRSNGSAYREDSMLTHHPDSPEPGAPDRNGDVRVMDIEGDGSVEVKDMDAEYDQEPDMQPLGRIERQLTFLDLEHADWKDYKDVKPDHFSNPTSFEAMRALFYSIKHANLAIIKEVDAKNLELIVNGFQANYERLTGQQKSELKKLFDKHSVLRDIGVCSFLWVAVEYAIQSKKVKNRCYSDRRDIVKLLAGITKNKAERHVVRTRGVPTWWSFLCLPCCGPCISRSRGVNGGLLHRAAKGNNGDIVRALLNNGFNITDEDEMGWTALSYALWFNGKAAERALVQKAQVLVGLSGPELDQFVEAARRKLPTSCCTC